MKWYKHDPDAFIAGTAELTLEEIGAYSLILDLLYSRNGNVPNDDRFICRNLRCNPRTWRRVKAALVAKGKIRVFGSNWTANRVELELNSARIRIELASNAAKKRWTINDKIPISHMRPGNANHNHNQNKKDGSDDPLPEKASAEKELFDRGKEILGQNAGGLIRKVLKAKGDNVALARAAIEQASTKQNPLEYAGRIAAGPPDNTPPSIRERTKVGGFYTRLDSPEQRAWERHTGKSIRDRDGGWTYPTQWPPDETKH